MKRKMFFCAAVLMGLLTACGAAGQTEASSEGTVQELESEEIMQTEAAEQETSAEETRLMIAAAASLEYAFREQLIPQYEAEHPGVIIEGTYDASGKLQTQIESGLEADIFMSAATKQMDALAAQDGILSDDTITDLLENKIVLIVPADQESTISSFEAIADAEAVAVGDPASVPVGQYAQEVLTALGIWDRIQDKLSLGTNVTEVLNWVAEGSADCGIVYATDAATTDRVKIVAEAPEGSLKTPVIYPIAMLQNADPEAAEFFEYLCSEEALKVFETYGFSPYQE